jgi:L-threonylcarbamoyladenylate synthase
MGWWHEFGAIRRLHSGEIVAHPTEGVFGLGCRAMDMEACRRVAELKRRSPKQPFITVVADFRQIEAAVDLSQIDFGAIAASWPGPETWIFPATIAAPKWLVSRESTMAVRVTGHAQFARLCAAVGPMISTSANPKSRQPALNLIQAHRYFGRSVDFYLNGELNAPGRPSRIRDAGTGLHIRA